MIPTEETPPPVLYKYYPPARIDVLQNGSVRFARPKDFNDSFDSHYRIADGRLGLKRTAYHYRNKVGIFCLTEDPDNQLMWVHYAEQQQGFVIGFRTRSALFGNNRPLRKVRYNLEPPSENEVDMEGACFYKAQQWDYEKEWRCVQTFSSAESRDVQLGEDDIAEVIVGSEMSDGHLVDILEALGTRVLEGVDNQIVLSKSEPLFRSWQFTHKPLDRQVCSRCYGVGHIST